jgi:NNP family nitrate/nitrite transporter-like MFS transporter
MERSIVQAAAGEDRIPAVAHRVLFMNTLAFTVCFAAWMLNGVLVTFLADNQVFAWGPVQIGWLLGIPVLTGALFRLPLGILTDRFGGRWVFGMLLLLCAVPTYLLSYADTFFVFALLSFGFGLTGASFAVGIAFTSVWYPKRWQGTALGIFGVGNAGAALTTLFAPSVLLFLTDHGREIERWRDLPKLYAVLLLATGAVFLLLTTNRKPAQAARTLVHTLAPLKALRVWRFGLYYFLVFGCFVALSQWLVPYFLNVYSVDLVSAGVFAGTFSVSAGVFRALGGWMADRWGPRKVMAGVLALSTLGCFLLVVPKMEIFSPGSGVMARRDGTVRSVSDERIVVDDVVYELKSARDVFVPKDDRMLILPKKDVWHEPLVQAGDRVSKKQLLAKGVTRIFFQANRWIATGLIVIVGFVWGVGMAAVYKYIPEYFPNDVGCVGGMVGVLGGLGGFFAPILFGYLLQTTGLWTSMWMFLSALSLACLLWMRHVVARISPLPSGFEYKPSD